MTRKMEKPQLPPVSFKIDSLLDHRDLTVSQHQKPRSARPRSLPLAAMRAKTTRKMMKMMKTLQRTTRKKRKLLLARRTRMPTRQPRQAALPLRQKRTRVVLYRRKTTSKRQRPMRMRKTTNRRQLQGSGRARSVRQS